MFGSLLVLQTANLLSGKRHIAGEKVCTEAEHVFEEELS